jgi:hypothetical protein
MNLTGNSNLVLDFYENGGGNQISFENLVLVLANNLTTNATQNVCQGTTGVPISGDTYGTLPTGISLNGTGYQWVYGTSSSGPWTNIAGATDATYSPNASASPFNVPGTYYICRNASLISTNNTGFPTYTATNTTNPATVTVLPSPTFTYTKVDEICFGGTTGSITITASGGTGPWTYSKDGTNYLSGPNPYTFSGLPAGTNYNLIIKDNNGCPSTTCP